ncbi:MAG: acyltransferase [Lachnospiraceae bacterium]|nr:acyltransferase [Lachnospiraceae bacterium]
MKKRDISVDLIKVVACIMVVMGHCTYAGTFPEEAAGLHQLFMYLFPLCNGMFFMMSGFYLFESRDLLGLWKRTLKGVVLPGVLMLFFWHYFYEFIVNGVPFSESGVFNLQDTISFVCNVILLKETSVYWYLSAYIWVILVWPLLCPLVDFLAKGPKREAWFLGISLGLFALNDLLGNRLFHFGFSGGGVLFPACVFVLWGHLLHKYRPRIMGRGAMGLAAAAFLFFMAIRFPMEAYYITRGPEAYLANWHNLPGLIDALCLCILGLNLLQRGEHPVLSRVLPFLSGYTFYIYLIHPFLIRVAAAHRFFPFFYEKFYLPGQGILYGIFYIITGCAVFYLPSLVLSIPLKKILSR